MPWNETGWQYGPLGTAVPRIISEKMRSAPSRIERIVPIVSILIDPPGVQQAQNIVPDRQIREIPTRKGVVKFCLKRKSSTTKAGLLTIHLEA